MSTMSTCCSSSSLSETCKDTKDEIWKNFINIEEEYLQQLLKLEFGNNVKHVYNPLNYAQIPHEHYVRKYCTGMKKVLLLGMNPGPWGMCQTGVPFGEVNYVKTWLKISGEVGKPVNEHEGKLIEGFNCRRTEVSGSRMWKLLKDISGDPDTLFQHVFIHNYCPLAFLSETGKNITPAELKVRERRPLEEICSIALAKIIKLLGVKYLVCIGNYTFTCGQKTVKKFDLQNVKVSLLMHPSPINPKANKEWDKIAMKQLSDSDVLKFFS